MKTKIAIFFLLLALASTAAAQDFNDRVRARAGVTSDGDIDATGQTIRGNALLQALEVRQATDGNPVQIGQPGLGQVQIYITNLGDAYEAEIRSTTGIPIRINGGDDQVRIIGGAAITGGTTNVNNLLEVNRSPVRIVWATGAEQGLQLTQSAADTTGLRAYLDTSTRIVHFDNTMSGAGGFAFSPALSNLPGATPMLTIYANSITMAATNSQYLTNYIDDTMYSLAWDRLLNEASTTTIAEYVLDASAWIMTHFESMKNATGTSLPDYIDSRIASYLLSATEIILPGTLTVGGLNVTSASISTLNVLNNITMNGTVTWASGTTFINPPTQTVDLTLVNQRLDLVELLAAQNYQDILSIDVSILSASYVFTGSASEDITMPTKYISGSIKFYVENSFIAPNCGYYEEVDNEIVRPRIPIPYRPCVIYYERRRH